MLGRHARPCECFLVVIFVVFCVLVFGALVLGVVPRI
jgi:hypothetical protein